jgi:ADP-ribosylglycohydrolase
MRKLPVGLVYDPPAATVWARRISVFAHFNQAAGGCCAVVSAAIAILRAGGTKEKTTVVVAQVAWQKLFCGNLNPSVDYVEATTCALTSFLDGGSVRDCVERAVSLGGDTDTIAAIAGDLAGVAWGMDNVPKG